MPFDSLRFRKSWRPYQQRVLDAIDQHLDDDRLHVVAAPGAGKTTLGLEVFRRLGKRTLVLSPTRVIRDQWIHRLDDFLEGGKASGREWVSRNIREPGLFTSITYQALHVHFAEQLAEEDLEQLDDDAAVAMLDEEELSETELNGFIDALKKHEVGVIILDEAVLKNDSRSGPTRKPSSSEGMVARSGKSMRSPAGNRAGFTDGHAPQEESKLIGQESMTAESVHAQMILEGLDEVLGLPSVCVVVIK